MPDSSLSAALKEAYASAPVGVISYVTLELRHSLLADPICVVRGKANLDATLEYDAPENGGETVTFVACDFDLVKPEVNSNGIPQCTVEIDNVSQKIISAIEEVLGSTELLKGTFREYLSTDLSGPQNDPPLHMDVMSIQADVFKIKAVLGFPNLLNRNFPTQSYDSERFPSLAA